jgi:hypothetical protein
MTLTETRCQCGKQILVAGNEPSLCIACWHADRKAKRETA